MSVSLVDGLVLGVALLAVPILYYRVTHRWSNLLETVQFVGAVLLTLSAAGAYATGRLRGFWIGIAAPFILLLELEEIGFLPIKGTGKWWLSRHESRTHRPTLPKPWPIICLITFGWLAACTAVITMPYTLLVATQLIQHEPATLPQEITVAITVGAITVGVAALLIWRRWYERTFRALPREERIRLVAAEEEERAARATWKRERPEPGTLIPMLATTAFVALVFGLAFAAHMK